MKIKVSASKLFTLFVALLPILYSYYSGIPGLSIAELILACFVIFSIFDRRKSEKNTFQKKADTVILVFFLYTIVNSAVASILYLTYIYDIWIRTIRLMFYLFCIINLPSKYIDERLLKKYTTVVCMLCAAFIVIQYVMYYSFNIIITGHIPFLRLYEESYFDSMSRNIKIFRPSGLFVEPSVLVWYMLPVLNFKINDDNKPFKMSSLICAVIITASMILSKSLFGLLTISIVWSSYLLYSFFIKKKNPILNFVFLLALPVVFYFVITSSVVRDTLTRINFSNLASSQSFAVRFLQYDLFNSLDILQKIFGVGIGNLLKRTAINNSIAYIITGNGIIGIIMVFAFFASLYKNSMQYCQKVFVLCLMVVSFGSNVLITCLSIYFTAFFITNRKESTAKVVKVR